MRINCIFRPSSESFLGDYLNFIRGYEESESGLWVMTRRPPKLAELKCTQKIKEIALRCLYAFNLAGFIVFDVIWWVGMTITIKPAWTMGKAHLINLISLVVSPFFVLFSIFGYYVKPDYFRKFGSRDVDLPQLYDFEMWKRECEQQGLPLRSYVHCLRRFEFTNMPMNLEYRSVDMMKRMLAKGDDVNKPDAEGNVFLHHLLHWDHSSSLGGWKYNDLNELGENLTQLFHWNQNSLGKYFQRIVSILDFFFKEHPNLINVNIENNAGRSPIHPFLSGLFGKPIKFAERIPYLQYKEVICKLLENGADFQVSDLEDYRQGLIRLCRMYEIRFHLAQDLRHEEELGDCMHNYIRNLHEPMRKYRREIREINEKIRKLNAEFKGIPNEIKAAKLMVETLERIWEKDEEDEVSDGEEEEAPEDFLQIQNKMEMEKRQKIENLEKELEVSVNKLNQHMSKLHKGRSEILTHGSSHYEKIFLHWELDNLKNRIEKKGEYLEQFKEKLDKKNRKLERLAQKKNLKIEELQQKKERELEQLHADGEVDQEDLNEIQKEFEADREHNDVAHQVESFELQMKIEVLKGKIIEYGQDIEKLKAEQIEKNEKLQKLQNEQPSTEEELQAELNALEDWLEKNTNVYIKMLEEIDLSNKPYEKLFNLINHVHEVLCYLPNFVEARKLWQAKIAQEVHEVVPTVPLPLAGIISGLTVGIA